ncbi:MAG: hypothetical protein EXX96DRAFT_609958 [Benjaminiella poitrasii]|nr:MAG: hypothetical protein EXX96DRAFT_609958 [Benjaminiella poitrasii]
MPKCDHCDYSFAVKNSRSRSPHSRCLTINKNEKGFTYPICHKSITTTRSFCRHLKQHSQNVSLYEEKHPNSCVELFYDNKHCMDEKETDGNANQHSVGNDGNIDKANNTEVDQLENTPSPPKLTDALDLLKLTFHMICLNPSFIINKRFSPIVIIDAEGHENNVLTHNNVVSRLCNNEKKSLTLKRTNNPKRCYDGTLKYGFCCHLSISKQTSQPGLSSILSRCPFKVL